MSPEQGLVSVIIYHDQEHELKNLQKTNQIHVGYLLPLLQGKHEENPRKALF